MFGYNSPTKGMTLKLNLDIEKTIKENYKDTKTTREFVFDKDKLTMNYDMDSSEFKSFMGTKKTTKNVYKKELTKQGYTCK